MNAKYFEQNLLRQDTNKRTSVFKKFHLTARSHVVMNRVRAETDSTLTSPLCQSMYTSANLFSFSEIKGTDKHIIKAPNLLFLSFCTNGEHQLSKDRPWTICRNPMPSLQIINNKIKREQKNHILLNRRKLLRQVLVCVKKLILYRRVLKRHAVVFAQLRRVSSFLHGLSPILSSCAATDIAQTPFEHLKSNQKDSITQLITDKVLTFSSSFNRTFRKFSVNTSVEPISLSSTSTENSR